MQIVLETQNLTKLFGMVRAVDDLNVRISHGEMIGIVGPNGSGKTTFLNLITGYIKPDVGHIKYYGKKIPDLCPRRTAKLGITRSFQLPQLYADLTVEEGLLLVVASRSGNASNFWTRLNIQHWMDEAGEILIQFGLGDQAHLRASDLSEGERKVLDIAMSFALRPRVLFMDEPTSGVSVKDKFLIMDTLVEVLKRQDMTTIFVEHDMDVVHRYAERILVFHEGKILADGVTADVLKDAAVRRTVLGEA